MAKRETEQPRGRGKHVNPFGVRRPSGPVPKINHKRSVPYTPRIAQTEKADAEETAAFAGPRVGDVMPTGTVRSREVSRAALGDLGELSPAQMRMRGMPTRPEDEGMTAEELDETEGQGPDLQFASVEEFERAVQNRALEMLNAQTKHANPEKPIARHPADAYDQRASATDGQGVGAMRTLHANGLVEHASGLSIVKLTIHDVDRLWDWLRGDGDQGESFLGHRISTSLALHQFVQQLAAAETQGMASIRSIYGAKEHLGFAMLAPILAAEQTALMHIYLREDIRGSLAQIVGPLVEMAQVVAPGLHLAVWSPDDVWARLHRKVLTPYGFKERTMFIR